MQTETGPRRESAQMLGNTRKKMTDGNDGTSAGRPGSLGRSAGCMGWLLIGFITLSVLELFCYAIGEFYIIPRANFIFYRKSDTKDITEGDFEDYIKKRHPILGWPSPSLFGDERYDRSGSRWIPSYPATGTEIVSLYGDSYTYAEDVSHEDAWSNILSRMIKGRVANFGVGGYGTDQAYLRFRDNIDDHAQTIVLTIVPDNLKRNVNQQRYFLSPSPGSVFGLKPRFILTDDALRLTPLPLMSYSEFMESFDEPERFFEHEFFLPDTPEGPICWSFPYAGSILKAIVSNQIRSWLCGKPGWYGFLDEHHPSGTLMITTHIIHDFVSLAEQRNRQAIVVILPSQTSYELYARTGQLAMKPLRDKLQERNIDAHILTEGIHQYLSGRDYSELKVSKASGHPHFNPEGNRLLAELVCQLIRKKGGLGNRE
jgi:hypothetical protein